MELHPVNQYYDAVAKEYYKIYNPEKLSYKLGVGDYIRLQIVIRILGRERAKSIFEVGVGDGNPLNYLRRTGMAVAGCDISEQMVETTRQRLLDDGAEEARIWKADICNALELAPSLNSDPFDVVMALGVMPHVEKDILALQNMRTLVRTGGKILVEFRNSLFSLFTFNRYTTEFILNDLLANVSDKTRKRVEEELHKQTRMDMPPVRDKAPDGSAPGYDVIRAKFHNPLEVPSMLAQAGFANPVMHWYHFHAAMPMLQDELGDQYDIDSLAMEHTLSNDWRGHFLCSAVLVEAEAI